MSLRQVKHAIFGKLGAGVDYNLDRRLRLLTEPEHKSLYTWAEHYARRIADGSADEVILGLNKVSGFYSEWSPDVFARDFKILANGDEQKVDLPVGLQFEPPRLGSIGEAQLYINANQVHAKPKEDDGDDPDVRPAPSLMRPEAAEQPAGIDPQTMVMLKSLRSSARWVTGLLALIAVVLVVKR